MAANCSPSELQQREPGGGPFGLPPDQASDATLRPVEPSTRKSQGLARLRRKSPIFGLVEPTITVSKTVSGGFPPTRVRIPPPPLAGVLGDFGGDTRATCKPSHRPVALRQRPSTGVSDPARGAFVPLPFPPSGGWTDWLSGRSTARTGSLSKPSLAGGLTLCKRRGRSGLSPSLHGPRPPPDAGP
jgi:hypothetical protein